MQTAAEVRARRRWRFLRHYLEMAVTMSAGIVAWMRHRGHGWASTLEMVGAATR